MSAAARPVPWLLLACSCGGLLGVGDDDEIPTNDPPAGDDAAVASDAQTGANDASGTDGPGALDGWLDDGSSNDADANLKKERVVFLSSTESDGNLGGLAMATKRCADLALAANLPGTFVAFLSVDGAEPSTVGGDGPWMLTNGTRAFDGNPTTNLPKVPVTRTESGAALTGQLRVWTGKRPAALPAAVNATCTQWTSTTPAGGFGLAETTAQWKEQGGLNQCANLARLYCFQTSPP